MTASYLLRPNQVTLQALDKYRTFPISTKKWVEDDQRCIAIYVRHGDKAREMKLVPFSEYVTVADYMWKHKLVQNNNNQQDKNKLHIFFGTETASVLNEAIQWSKTANMSLYHTNLYDLAPRHSSQHKLAYISMLLNLEYSLKCDAWVCTTMSNWCRVIDELRATVGGKANYQYADLSRESYSQALCIDGRDMRDFEW